jgi:hypothetical protein
MSFRWPRIVSLLMFVLCTGAFPIALHAQSLGEVARQIRAERSRESSHARVFTNEDIASAEPAAAPKKAADSDASADAAKGEDKETAADATSKDSAKKASPAEADEATPDKSGKKTEKSSAKDREAQELETQKRTKEINEHYTERITTLRAQIYAAEQELARLQRDQVESTAEFHRSAGASPGIPVYEQQQRLFDEQIESQRTQIKNLNAELEDAQEAARHAGVPHASD